MNIYIGNLPFNLGEEDLKEIFEEYGEVASAKIISDKMKENKNKYPIEKIKGKYKKYNEII